MPSAGRNFNLHHHCTGAFCSGCAVFPRFEDKEVEERYAVGRAAERTRFAPFVWLPLTLIFGIAANTSSVLDFAIDGKLSPAASAGEPLHVGQVIARILITFLLIHATISSCASRNQLRSPFGSATSEERSFATWHDGSTTGTGRTSGHTTQIPPTSEVATKVEFAGHHSDGSSKNTFVTDRSVTTGSTPTTATTGMQCPARIWRWLSLTGWTTSCARDPTTSVREGVVIIVASVALYQFTSVVDEAFFQRCLALNDSLTAEECGLWPPGTDAPTRLYAPSAIFADIYFASSVVLFQMSFASASFCLGLFLAWWVSLAIFLAVLGILVPAGAVTYVLLRLLLIGFLLYAVRTNDLSARRAFVWNELQTVSAEVVKKRTKFLAHVSHEIRTPLHVMILGQALLLDTSLTEDQRTVIKMAEMSGDMVLAMLRDTLDLAALDDGGITLMPRRVPVTKVCEISPLLSLAESRGLRLRLSISSKCPRTVVIDAERVSQVIWNLTANALKYTERGSVTVRVDSASLDGELVWRSELPEALLIRVLDTGRGIPLGLEDILFDRFTRAVDDGTAAATGGVGLGLSIVKELTALWNGRVGCCNRADRIGACFWFTVPIRPAGYISSRSTPTTASPKTSSRSDLEESSDEHNTNYNSDTSLLSDASSHSKSKVGMHLKGSSRSSETSVRRGRRRFRKRRYRRQARTKLSEQLEYEREPYVDCHIIEDSESNRHIADGGNKSSSTSSSSRVPIGSDSMWPESDEDHRCSGNSGSCLARKVAFCSSEGSRSTSISSTTTNTSSTSESTDGNGAVGEFDSTAAAPNVGGSSHPFEPAIIIADDNSANRKILELYLRRVSSARLLVAADGDEASMLWDNNREQVRLILMDHHMPNCDGVDAVRRIRGIEDALGRPRSSSCDPFFPTPSLSIWRGRVNSPRETESASRTAVPVLCITASASARDVSGTYRNARFDGVVAKPFHRDTLEAALRHFCPDLLLEPHHKA